MKIFFNLRKSLSVRLASTAVFILLVDGCVTAGTYDALNDEHIKTQQNLVTCDQERTDLQKKLGISTNEKSKLEGSVVEMKRALLEAEVRKQETEKRLNEFKELTSKFKHLVDAGKLSIKVQNGRMMIALSTDILFPSGSAQLSKEGIAAIQEVTVLLKGLKDRKFQIEGHTDNLPIHSKHFPSNWELASARAMSVLNTMLAQGFPDDHISTASYASTEPVADNKTLEGRLENRRIDIVVVPDLSTLPGFEELNRLSTATPQPTVLPVPSVSPSATPEATPQAIPQASPQTTPQNAEAPKATPSSYPVPVDSNAPLLAPSADHE